MHVGHSSWLERFRGKPGGFLGDAVIEHLDHYGQDMVVGFPTANVITDYADATDWILEVARAHPDRVVPFTRINPNFEETAAASLDGRVAKGVRGIKFHPHMDAYPVNDERLMRPVMEEANRLKLVVLIHSGESWFSAPGLIFTRAGLPRNIKFIIGHSGSYGYHHEAMVMARKADNIWLDTTEIYPASVIRRSGPEGRQGQGGDGDGLAIPQRRGGDGEKVFRFNELTDDEPDQMLWDGPPGCWTSSRHLSAIATGAVHYPIKKVFW